MITYELINPSDPYTFKAPNIEIAGLCAVLLSTSFGATQVDPPNPDNERTPVLFGWNEWLKDRGINEQFIENHLFEISEAFDSFLIGDINKRRDVEEMLALIPAEKQEEWKANRQERHRTSMNRIGEAAMRNAKAYRAAFEKNVKQTTDQINAECEVRAELARKAQFEEDLKSL